ncbi:MAG TPA: YHYH protein [Patescibacteria group bacterium]|nr:YHYH protein [Patescibacteria group bacterium]
MKRARIIFGLALAASLLGYGLVRAATAPANSLVKASGASVYYYGSDGKRYVFPNEKTYLTWYADFSTVRTVSDAELASMPIGGNVTYRPGVRMIKVTTDPKVYAVDAGGKLRAIPSESVAAALYGSDWNKKIDDVPDAFFVNYTLGLPLSSASDFAPSSVTASVPSIAADRGLSTASAAIDLHALPIGDGKYKTSAAKGYIYSCQTSFNGGGAFATGAWVNGTTWDPSLKPTVDGSVSWPSANFTITVSGSNRVFTGNGLPEHATGKFPIATTDDAYQYDRNPNSISTQTLSYTLPKDPTVAASVSCVGGEVGIALSGIPIFNGFDAGGRDAVAHEIQDACGGHPQSSGQYHYHGPSACSGTGDSELFGYAYDGFGIFSKTENGKTITNDDLDECHGHTHEITWDGVKKTMYHYHLTNEFPYTVGCYKGKSYWTGPSGGGQGGMMPPPPRF